MEVNCEKCSQKYHIPENRLSEKKVYFLCEKCGHRIIINPPLEGWFKNNTFGRPPFTAGSLINSISGSFSLKSVLIAFFFLYSISISIGISSFVFYKNTEFFASHPVFTASIFVIFIIILKFFYDFMLYLLSLNAFYRFENDQNIKYIPVSHKIIADSPKVMFFSFGGILLLIILTIPVLLLQNSGLLYAAIALPFITAAAALAVWAHITKGFLYSLIAFNQRSLKQTFKTIGRFIIVENINIVIYAFSIKLINSFISIIVISVFALPLIPVSMILAPFIAAGSASATGPDAAAAIILIFFGSVFVVLAASWLTTIKQTLCSAAIRIMESNPGNSISGGTRIIVIVLLAAFFFIISGLTVLVLTSLGFAAALSGIASWAVIEGLL